MQKILSFFSGIFWILFLTGFFSFVVLPVLQINFFEKITVSVLAAATPNVSLAPVAATTTENSEKKSSETAVPEANTNEKKTEDESKVDDSGKTLKQKVSEISSFLVSFFVPLIAVCAKLIGILMGNEYIMGSMGAQTSENITPIGQVLYELWLVFRDIMNYLFIFILMLVGLMNIIPGKGDNFEIKSMLPRLVMAIVVINFTWFGAKVILDASDVAAHAVFSLPQSVIGDRLEFNAKNEELTPEDVKNGKTTNLCKFKSEGAGNIPSIEPGYMCMPIAVKINDPPAKNTKEMAIGTVEGAKLPAGVDAKSFKQAINYGQMTVFWGDFDYEKFNKGTIAPLYAFSIMQVQNLPRIAKTLDEKNEVGWSTLAINALMSLIVMILVIIVFVVMLIVLFFRIIYLWINIVASPFLGLLMFEEQLGVGFLQKDEDGLGVKSFIEQAFLPAIIGLPLTVGFIIISVGQKYQYSIDTQILENNALTQTKDMVLDLSGRTLINGVQDLHHILFYILALVVMWKSVEIGSSLSKHFAKTLVDKVSDGAKGAAGFIASAPMYAQFIPVKGSGGGDGNKRVSLATLAAMPGAIASGRQTELSQDMAELQPSNPDGSVGHPGTTSLVNNFESNVATTIKGALPTNKTEAKTELQKLKEIDTKSELESWVNRKFGAGSAVSNEIINDKTKMMAVVNHIGYVADVGDSTGSELGLAKNAIQLAYNQGQSAPAATTPSAAGQGSAPAQTSSSTTANTGTPPPAASGAAPVGTGNP